MEETENKHIKPKFWLGFSVGLLVGLVFATVFYFVDKSLNDPIKLLVTTPSADTTETEEKEAEPEPNPYIGKQLTNTPTKAKNSRSDSITNTLSDTMLAEVEFSMKAEQPDNNVYQEKCLSHKTVTVKSLDEGVTSPIATFEVEEWSESVMNKTTYHRVGNLLKIKGLKTQNIKILFSNGHYFIETNGHRYSIPENDDFKRLVLAN